MLLRIIYGTTTIRSELRKMSKQTREENVEITTSSTKASCIYYKKKIDTSEEDALRVCIRSDDDRLRVLESCHAGMEGNMLVSYSYTE